MSDRQEMKEPKLCPVTDWRNEQLDGHTLSAQVIWDDYKASVEQARAQQARYRESIPQDPEEALRQALRALHPDGEHHVRGLDLALHALSAIHTIARHELEDASRDTRDTVRYFAREAFDQLEEALASLDHIAKLVGAAYKNAKQR